MHTQWCCWIWRCSLRPLKITWLTIIDDRRSILICIHMLSSNDLWQLSFFLYWFFHHSIIVAFFHLILSEVNFPLFLWPYHLRWLPLINWVYISNFNPILSQLTFFLKVYSRILVNPINNLLWPDLPLILPASKYIPKQLSPLVLDLLHYACLWLRHLTLLFPSRIVSGMLTQHGYHHWCIIPVLIHHRRYPSAS